MFNKPSATTSLLAAIMLMMAPLANADISKYKHPFYLGFTAGYGTTLWNGLVPPRDKRNGATAVSTPIRASEGGGTGGVVIGYEIIPTFAVEAAYARYADADVTFDKYSLFAFEHDGHTVLNTHTETVSLSGKVMVFIPRTDIRVFSSAGAAGVHRYDEAANHWRASPTFGVGFNYDFTDRFMGELGANYTAGYGQSELRPAEVYIPFLYSVFLRLAIRL